MQPSGHTVSSTLFPRDGHSWCPKNWLCPPCDIPHIPHLIHHEDVCYENGPDGTESDWFSKILRPYEVRVSCVQLLNCMMEVLEWHIVRQEFLINELGLSHCALHYLIHN